jgi:NADP-dependent 3-hydroxy acid dehydrogenase YdfG
MIMNLSSNVASIFEQIWEHSPKLKIPSSYEILQKLTSQVMNSYEADGRLDENPFESTKARVLSLPETEINEIIKGKICLVTGGLGCVGTLLVSKLLLLNAKVVIIIDKKPASATNIHKNTFLINTDITDEVKLNEIFKTHKPELVFHVAAQRDPGLAELNIRETVSTNVLGTLNIVNACENHKSVKQCVFSSTGKASRYYTDEVYAATKKIAEYIFDTYAKKSAVLYSMVRFTHILDNSLMNIKLRNQTNGNYMSVHSPGKYVTAQNVKESVNLLLNALLVSRPKQCKFLIVRFLEWPVESLAVALYYLKQSGKKLPVIFEGNPPGYTEKFFRGQLNWANPKELNLLINVFESKTSALNEAGDIIISQVAPTNQSVLQDALTKIKEAKGDRLMKQSLLEGLQNIVSASLMLVEKSDTLNILNWGLDPQYLSSERASVSDFGLTVSLLQNSLKGSLFYDQITSLKHQADHHVIQQNYEHKINC